LLLVHIIWQSAHPDIERIYISSVFDRLALGVVPDTAQSLAQVGRLRLVSGELGRLGQQAFNLSESDGTCTGTCTAHLHRTSAGGNDPICAQSNIVIPSLTIPEDDL
jgi:hypothetical protein